MKKILALLFITLVLSCNNNQTADKDDDLKSIISVNQEGYLSSGEKYFITNIESQSFNVKSAENDQSVFNGAVELFKENDISTGETLYIGYFSDLTTHGEYYIEIDSEKKSYNFLIGNDVFNDVRDKSLKSFYYQRSGIDLLEDHAGDYKRNAGHTSNLSYHPSHELFENNPDKTLDVSGGWYDAGDYGRYITPASVSLAVMLIGYENYSDKFSNKNLNIPESDNDIPDFLDEMKYELDWMLKMQDKDDEVFKGALPYMLNSEDYVGGMPADLGEGDTQFIYGFSSIATADFAAIMALASRLFSEIDKEYASTCLDAAKLAWEYLEKNSGVYPDGGYQRPESTETGGYAQSKSTNNEDIDDRLWAAIELYRTTGDESYINYYESNYSALNSSWETVWGNVRGYAKIQYILTNEHSVSESIRSSLKSSFLNQCDEWVDISDNDGFKTVLKSTDYRWGNNGEVLLNRAALILLAYEETKDTKYYDTALKQLNYILGLNVLNMSFVTHTGSKSPKYIHHAMFQANDYDYVFPGLLAGGPNSSLGDPTLEATFSSSTPAAKCYLDESDSWASNENCILYNAPLVPVSAYFSN